MMNRDDIAKLLPHRGDFALLDRVVEVEPGQRVLAEVDVRQNAFWAAGHFPAKPIMPGVLIAEAMAQAAGVVYMTGPDRAEGELVYLVGFDKLRIRAMVTPDCTLQLDVKKATVRRRFWTFECEAYVNGKRVANGTMLASAGPAE